MEDAAKKRLEGQDVEFMEGSSEELPLADASFDRYAANFVLYVAPSSPSSPQIHATRHVDHPIVS
jgi:ubiquinone/menaquinone biosynthesis C-methylase UbiE